MENLLTRSAARGTFYVVLLVIAALVNAAGYLLTLWHDETLFDEAVHMYTGFAVIAAIGHLGRRNGWLPSGARGWLALLACGAVLGLAWEAFEFAIGIIGDSRDTMIDLVMDMAGAFVAAALLAEVSARCRGGAKT